MLSREIPIGAGQGLDNFSPSTYTLFTDPFFSTNKMASTTIVDAAAAIPRYYSPAGGQPPIDSAALGGDYDTCILSGNNYSGEAAGYKVGAPITHTLNIDIDKLNSIAL